MVRTVLIGMLALLGAASAQAQGVKAEDAWARRAAMMDGKSGGSGNGAVYLKIRNAGPAGDALVGASSSAAEKVELHESYRDMNMMMMRPVDRLELPAGKSVELKPGGYHLMLLNLKHDLKPGAKVDVILRFRNAGEVPVSAAIR